MPIGSTASSGLDRVSLVVWTATAGTGSVLATASEAPLWGILLGAALLGAAQLIRVPTPSGDSLDIGLAVAAAVPFLAPDGFAVGAIYSLGLLASSLVVLGASDGATKFLPTALGLAGYGLIFQGALARGDQAGLSQQVAELLAVAAAGLTWYMVSALVRAVAGYQRDHFAFRYLWLRGLEDWPVVVGLVAAGALFGLAFPVLRWWAIPMAGMSYGFSHLAFVRYQGTRVTYGQTIRALARIPEAAGLAIEGHAARTAAIAEAIGRDLGLEPRRVAELEYAALMHDIGRIALNEPAILKAGYTDEDIARWGAEIIAEAPYLRRVVGAVRQQHHPFRQPGEERDEALPTASRVIKVASAFDQAVSETGLDPLEAVEVLHRGAAYDFDPKVVSSLRRVLARRGTIAY